MIGIGGIGIELFLLLSGKIGLSNLISIGLSNRSWSADLSLSIFVVIVVSVIAAVVLLTYFPSFFYVNMEFDTFQSRKTIIITV